MNIIVFCYISKFHLSCQLNNLEPIISKKIKKVKNNVQLIFIYDYKMINYKYK